MPEKASLPGANIVIIDDEPANIRLLEMMLSDAGYISIRSFLDPLAAVEAFEESCPDIILLDLHMPEIDGFEVMERLEPRLCAGESVPVVVLTADMTSAVKRRALSAGASDFVAKPFDTQEVLLRVKNLLTTRWAHLQVLNQNKILELKVQERTSQLQASQYETLERLAMAGEYRDDATGKHTLRVGRRAAELALALKLPADQIELLRRAAPLHDIGKIGIPDLILLKPGKLTPEEFEIIKTHTTIGAAMLANSQTELLQLAEEIALSHHERWDGSGYPARLAGESIPISGHIVSICDVFDALTNERPYKKAWPVADAISEIKSQAGKQFNPAVVEAFVFISTHHLFHV